MRRFLLLFCCLHLLLAVPGRAQNTATATEIKGGVLKTAAGSVLVFNNYHDQKLNFSLTIAHGAVRATERPGLYAVDELPLQVLAVPLAPFKTDSAATTLQRYMSSEAAYQQDAMQRPLVPFGRLAPDENGQLYAIWGFAMPKGLDEHVAQQLFIVFIDGDFIVSLGSIQTQGQDIDKPLDLLLATARSYKSSPAPIKLR